MATDCSKTIANIEIMVRAEKPLHHERFLKANPANTQPWKGIMQQNLPGKRRAGAAVFLAQGTADKDCAARNHKTVRRSALPARNACDVRDATRHVAYLCCA